MSINLQRLDVLIVDDNPHMRILIREILHSIGIRNITESSEGTEAIAELRLKPVDFVITDWVMEPLDGLEFTKLVRTADDSPSPFVPIIMLTGHTEHRRIIEARDAGVTEFLAKPVTANGLYARIKELVDNPRPFVRVGNYFGPCRRRKVEDFAGIKRRDADAAKDTAEISTTEDEGQEKALGDAAEAVNNLQK